jgi:hypothetical protein
VVSFTPLPLYPRGKSPRYPLDRRLDGPQSRSGRRGEEKILDPTGTRTPTPAFTGHISETKNVLSCHSPSKLAEAVAVLVEVLLDIQTYPGNKCHKPTPENR